MVKCTYMILDLRSTYIVKCTYMILAVYGRISGSSLAFSKHDGVGMNQNPIRVIKRERYLKNSELMRVLTESHPLSQI